MINSYYLLSETWRTDCLKHSKLQPSLWHFYKVLQKVWQGKERKTLSGLDGNRTWVIQIGSHIQSLKEKLMHPTFWMFFICLSSEFLPVSGPLTRWCALTLGAALLCSSRTGSWFGACIQIGIYPWNQVLPMPYMLSTKLYSPTLLKGLHTTYVWFMVLYCRVWKRSKTASTKFAIPPWQGF